MDNNDSDYITCSLVAYNPSNGSGYALGGIGTVGMPSSSSLRTLHLAVSDIPASYVDNSVFQYRLWVSFQSATTSSLRLYGAKVTVGYPFFLPVVAG